MLFWTQNVGSLDICELFSNVWIFALFIGYQKGKAEEAKILESLREEGLLAKPKGKTAGGMAFEVVDSSVVEKKGSTENEDAFVTAEFMPSKTLKRLELRRGVSSKKSFKENNNQ